MSSVDLKEKESWVKEAAAFLKHIIPQNWNILPGWCDKGMSFKPNALNINVWFVELEEEEDFLGMVRGPLHFYPLGVWASVLPASRRASKEFPHAFFHR